MTKEEAVSLTSKIKYPKIASIYTGDNGFVIIFKVKPTPGTNGIRLDSDGCIIVQHQVVCDYTNMNDTQVLAAIYDAIAEYEVHEASEWFLYNGIAPFHSHALQDNGPTIRIDINCVAPRLKDLDLAFVQTHRALDAKARDLLNQAEAKICEFEEYNILKRLALALFPNLW